MGNKVYIMALILLIIVAGLNAKNVSDLKEQVSKMNQAILFSGQIVPIGASISGNTISIKVSNAGLMAVDSFIIKYALISNKIDDGVVVNPDSTVRWAVSAFKRTVSIPPQQALLMRFSMEKHITDIPDHKHLLVLIESPSGAVNKQIYNYTDGLLYIQDANHYELKDVFAYKFGMMSNYQVRDYQGEK